MDHFPTGCSQRHTSFRMNTISNIFINDSNYWQHAWILDSELPSVFLNVNFFFCLFMFAYANINLSSTYMLTAPSSVTNQQYKHCGNKESVLLLEAMGETFSNQRIQEEGSGGNSLRREEPTEILTH